MSEDQIIERIELLIDEELALFHDGSFELTADPTPALARRVVQGLGLHEEIHVLPRGAKDVDGFLINGTPAKFTRLVTDWQEDTPHD